MQILFDKDRYASLKEFVQGLKERLFDFGDYQEQPTSSHKLIIGHTRYPRDEKETGTEISVYVYPLERTGEISFFTSSAEVLGRAVEEIKKITKLDDLDVAPIPMDVIRMAS